MEHNTQRHTSDSQIGVMPYIVDPERLSSIHRLMYTLKEFPTTEDFVYLKCRNQNPSEYKPYALEVVQFADVDPADYYTMSVRGLTHYVDGLNADFTSE